MWGKEELARAFSFAPRSGVAKSVDIELLDQINYRPSHHVPLQRAFQLSRIRNSLKPYRDGCRLTLFPQLTLGGGSSIHGHGDYLRPSREATVGALGPDYDRVFGLILMMFDLHLRSVGWKRHF
jgi:hypothetical protein